MQTRAITWLATILFLIAGLFTIAFNASREVGIAGFHNDKDFDSAVDDYVRLRNIFIGGANKTQEALVNRQSESGARTPIGEETGSNTIDPEITLLLDKQTSESRAKGLAQLIVNYGNCAIGSSGRQIQLSSALKAVLFDPSGRHRPLPSSFNQHVARLVERYIKHPEQREAIEFLFQNISSQIDKEVTKDSINHWSIWPSDITARQWLFSAACASLGLLLIRTLSFTSPVRNTYRLVSLLQWFTIFGGATIVSHFTYHFSRSRKVDPVTVLPVVQQMIVATLEDDVILTATADWSSLTIGDRLDRYRKLVHSDKGPHELPISGSTRLAIANKLELWAEQLEHLQTVNPSLNVSATITVLVNPQLLNADISVSRRERSLQELARSDSVLRETLINLGTNICQLATPDIPITERKVTLAVFSNSLPKLAAIAHGDFPAPLLDN